MTMKLSGNGLPENFFPSYVSIKAYVKMLEDINSSSKKKKGMVPSAPDCQKEDTKFCFVEMKHKAEAEPEVKAAEGKGKKGSANRAHWRKHPKKNNSA
jgi:hypothetical protein